MVDYMGDIILMFHLSKCELVVVSVNYVSVKSINLQMSSMNLIRYLL